MRYHSLDFDLESPFDIPLKPCSTCNLAVSLLDFGLELPPDIPLKPCLTSNLAVSPLDFGLELPSDAPLKPCLTSNLAVPSLGFDLESPSSQCSLPSSPMSKMCSTGDLLHSPVLDEVFSSLEPLQSARERERVPGRTSFAPRARHAMSPVEHHLHFGRGTAMSPVEHIFTPGEA